MTDTRFGGGSENVTDSSKSITIDHSKNSTNDDDTQLGDGSKMIGSDSSKSGESENTKEEDAMSDSSRKKEGFHGEECDPSNMCTDDQHEFAACLRVPGNGESLLNLFIYIVSKTDIFLVLGFELCFFFHHSCVDAPHLSLLIQNKGKRALIVTITAPGFVRLEKDKVQLLQNEDTKVIPIC